MERRAASHTEEEEMNQRRRLLGLARKGDPKAISKLFELYQVRVLSGDVLSKMNRSYYKSASQQKNAASGSAKANKSEKGTHGNRKSGPAAPVKGSRKAKGGAGKQKSGR